MKKSLFVASVMSKMNLPVTILENDINKHNRFRRKMSGRGDLLLPGFENISWHFTHTSVSGEIEIVFANKWNNKTVCVDVPATTGFLATCMQAKNGSRKLTFGASLS